MPNRRKFLAGAFGASLGLAVMSITTATLASYDAPKGFHHQDWFMPTIFDLRKDHGLKLGEAYKPSPQGLTGLSGYLSQVGEDDAIRQQTASDGDAWFSAIIKEMFS